MKQARDGEYLRNSDGALKFFWIFSWLWVWILNLFDSNHYQVIWVPTKDAEENPLNMQQTVPMQQPGNPQIQAQPWNAADPLSQMGINETIGNPMA
jgi:hypothetical protein